MTRMPTPLPLGVQAEEFAHANGETITIYRAPFQMDGPITYVDRDGDCVMAFMYANFVFVWRQDWTALDIRHGYIDSDSMMLFRNVPIAGPWRNATLVAFGVAWAREHLARFGGIGREGLDA
jgi:hypothetical protein